MSASTLEQNKAKGLAHAPLNLNLETCKRNLCGLQNIFERYVTANPPHAALNYIINYINNLDKTNTKDEEITQEEEEENNVSTPILTIQEAKQFIERFHEYLSEIPDKTGALRRASERCMSFVNIHYKAYELTAFRVIQWLADIEKVPRKTH